MWIKQTSRLARIYKRSKLNGSYPATDGRTLVTSRQYMATIYEISVDHQAAVCDGLQVRTRLIDRTEAGRRQYRRE
jgi:hypothetical protein